MKGETFQAEGEKMPKITFLPSNISIEFTDQENILKAAMKAGVHINASCGGAGVCDKCRIYIEEGEVQGDQLSDGAWRACTTIPLTDIVVRVPAESQMDKKALIRPIAKKSASWIMELSEQAEVTPPAPIYKTPLKLPEPDLADAVADLERVRREIGHDTHLQVESRVLNELPYALRDGEWQISATFMETPVSNSKQLIRVEPKRDAKPNMGIAIDIGTTTISAQLLDLQSGSLLSEASDYNPQVSYGEDVISRMEFARKGDGLKILQQKVVECLNGLITELCKKTNRDRNGLDLVTIGANTVMSHFLLGLETKFLRAQPYIPVASEFPPVCTRDIGLDLPAHTRMMLAPCVASYVGGDIVAGVVGINMNHHPELTLFIDIGTNGEIVLGNQDWMACAACSAGPAFEGGGIKFGMRATTGAVEVVDIHPATYEPMALTIGGKKAKGICGSGIISLLAGLFLAGAIDRQGKFRRDLPTDRIRKGEDGYEYVVVEKESTSIDQDIVFTEADIENLIRAKGAMFAGYLTLLESVGMTIQDIERVVLAGNFGSYLDLEQAITIGLLPDIPRDRFFFAGNTSLLGAKMMALSWKKYQEMVTVAQMMTHFDLSDNPRFMDHYVSCLFLPHTDLSFFPSVQELLQV